MVVKVCSDCGIEKELNKYYSQEKSRKDGTKYIYYRPDCKECTNKRTRKWQGKNIEKKRQYHRKFVTTKSYKISQKKTMDDPSRKLYIKEYQRKNKDKFKLYREQHRYHDITETEWLSCKEYFNNECAYCGLHLSEHYNMFKGEMIHTDFHKEHVDHEGANDLSNCVPACKSCNCKKWQYSLNEWYNGDNEFHNGFSEERLHKIYKWINSDYQSYKEIN